MNNNMDIEKLAYNHGANIYENGEVRFYTLNAFNKFAEAYHQAKCNEEIQTLRAKVAKAEGFNLEQILHDPENQPSQYGTVPLEWYENLENKINRIRFNVEQVIESITGGSDMYAIRKQLQTAVDNKSLATYDKLSELNMTQKDEALKMAIELLGELIYFLQNGKEVNISCKKSTICLYKAKAALSEPEQVSLPDGWKPIETAPNDGTQVIIKCSGGRVATAFYDDKPFVGEGWHVVVPFLGGFGSGTDTFIYFPEDMPTHWMPLPEEPTTSETNTEVGNELET